MRPSLGLLGPSRGTEGYEAGDEMFVECQVRPCAKVPRKSLVEVRVVDEDQGRPEHVARRKGPDPTRALFPPLRL